MLRFLIDQNDVMQAEIARSASILESRISEVLCGNRKPTRMQITKLAAHFRVSPAVFLPAGPRDDAKEAKTIS
jgi:transcriptional regulator with XRE-family HTH domain